MIAPVRDKKRSAAPEGLHGARHYVASLLLPDSPPAADVGPPVIAWRAWVYAAWVIAAAACYFVKILLLS